MILKVQIKEVKIEELNPAEYNPRGLTKKEYNNLKESLTRFGLVEPIVVNGAENRRNIVIGGHQRLKIVKDLGHKTIPVVYIKIEDIKKEQELNIRLNKNLGHWDYDLLANFDDDMLIDVGFESEEIEKIFLGTEDFEDDEMDFDYPFGTINSWVRIGDYSYEIENSKYKILEKRIKEVGGIDNFIDKICIE